MVVQRHTGRHQGQGLLPAWVCCRRPVVAPHKPAHCLDTGCRSTREHTRYVTCSYARCCMNRWGAAAQASTWLFCSRSLLSPRL